MPADRSREARLAGLLYLLTIVAGLFAELVARGRVREALAAGLPGGFTAVESWHRIAILADLVMIAAYLAVTLLLYRLLRRASELGSALAALFSLAGLAMLAAALALLAAPLIEPALAGEALRLHGRVYGLTGFFFGLYCLMVGGLLRRATLAPGVVAALMALAGVAFLADSVLTLAAPDLWRQVPDGVMLFSLVGEGAVAGWLTLFGNASEARHNLHHKDHNDDR